MTAVEFAVEEINKLTGLNIAMDEPCVEQALEMEKEQIGDAWENGKKSTQCKTPMCERKTGIGYYNKTFKQEQ
jgi:hypothetical protein